jgi:hypothetical protein
MRHNTVLTMRVETMPVARLIVLLGLVCLGSGCTLGPRNITPDRFNYTEAIAQSNHEQLLSNLVRLRYSEPPVFLGIGSVLTQYVYSGRISVSGAASQETTAVPGWTVGGSASGTYIERPTITYAPLAGQDYAHQLLAPIDSQAVFALLQSGWSSDDLLKLTIEGINQINGRLRTPVPTPAELDEVRRFRRLIGLLVEASSRRAIEMHRDSKNPTERYIDFAEATDAETSALAAELKAVLGLDPERSRFRVTDRDIRSADEVTIRVRSFGSMLALASRGIDVPAAHIEEQRTIAMTTPQEDPDVAALVRIRVRSQTERPDNAFVAIRYQGEWFFIPNNDYQSKKTFGLLAFLLQIQAPASAPVGGPVLTVPTG